MEFKLTRKEKHLSIFMGVYYLSGFKSFQVYCFGESLVRGDMKGLFVPDEDTKKSVRIPAECP